MTRFPPHARLISWILQAGHSVLAHITHFLPYFYVSVPRGFAVDDLQSLRDHINNNLAQPSAVERLEIVKKRSLWGFRGDGKPLFLKITICDQRTLPKVRGLFERGELQFRELFTEPVTTYESNIAYTLRFMIDTHVSPLSLPFRLV
jgi:DNA polymerase delta subunit 1